MSGNFSFKIPMFPGYKPSPCCIETFKEIDEKIRLTRYLQGTLSFSMWFSWTTAHPAEFLVNFDAEESSRFAHAIVAASTITINRCRVLAEVEWSHNHLGGPERKFWRHIDQLFLAKQQRSAQQKSSRP